jgi:translocation and assembly module TamB
MAAWIGASLVALLVLVVVTVIVLLHNPSFQGYILKVAQQKASQAVGSKVQAKSFALRWRGVSPTVELYDVVVHGAAPYPDPPLLCVDHMGLQVTISSLLHRTWYLSDVRIDHPVVRVFVDSRGVDNLPQTKTNSQSHTSVFDLGVRHLLLDRGEIYYNNRKSVLNADVHDFNLQSKFATAEKQYSGTLAYRDGRITLENLNPMVHSLEAQFSATPQAFTLQRATLTSGASQFVLAATVQDYAHPRLQANYQAILDTGELQRIMKNPSLPVGVIHAAGSMQYASQPDRPMLALLTAGGELSSRGLTVRTPSLRVEIRDLGARYSLAHGNLEVRNMRGRMLGGNFSGDLTMRDLAGASRSNLKATLRGVSLSQLKSLTNSPALQRAGLDGAVNATADAAWGKTFNDLVARADASIQGQLAPAGSKPLPLNGGLHITYAAASKEISLRQSYLWTPQSSLTLNGSVGDRSNLQVEMQSRDLHELEVVVDALQTPSAGQPASAQALGLYGSGTFSGTVRGTANAPELSGQLNAANLRLKGSSWRTLRTNLQVSPSVASLQNGDAEPLDGGRITFNIRAGLRHWSFSKTSPLEASLNASRINVADLTKLAGSQMPVAGTLTADVSINGTELNPAGHGSLSLTHGKIGSEPVQSLKANFQGTGNDVHANLAVQIAAGSANAVLTYYPREQRYDAQLQSTGIHLEQLQTVKERNLQLAGILTLTASGHGTLANPEVQASAQIPSLQMRDQSISGLTLQATVANHVANFALDSRVINTAVQGRGTVDLAGNYFANASLDTQTIPLGPLVALYAPSLAGDLSGNTEIHATLRGPLKDKSLLEAHVTLPQLNISYRNTVKLAEASPIHIDFSNGVLELRRAAIRGTGTDLQFEGRIPTSSSAPASLLLLGTVDLRLAQMLDPEVSSSGQLRFDINSYGQRADPNVQGKVEIVNANFATGSAPIGLQNGNGVLTLTKDRLNITQFRGTVGGGTVSASGGVVYRPSVQFDLALAANGIRMLYPETVRSALNGNLALSGSTQAALLRGQVRITGLSFTPDFDLSDFVNQFSGESTPPPAQGFSQNLQLDVGLQSVTGINLQSRELSLDGTANLHVTGTAAEPVILGRVNLNGGDLIYQKNRFVLQSGTIDFSNPSRTQPVMNVSVSTTIQQYNIQARFWGPLDQLHTNYASDPALPPADIINLVAGGQTTEAAAANPMPGYLGAESFIASQVSGQVTSRLAKVAGISQLSIDPVLGSNQQGVGARVAVQQKVTSKIYVTFASDTTSTQSEEIKLEYQLSPRVTVNAVRNQNGGVAFDARIHKTW